MRCLMPIIFYMFLELLLAAVVTAAPGGAVKLRLHMMILQEVLCLPFFFWLYLSDGRAGWRPAERSSELLLLSWLILTAGFDGFYLLLNLTISLSRLGSIDAGFQSAAQLFSEGKFAERLLLTALLAPAAEELMFRGLLLRRLSVFCGENRALLFSALAFGLFHGNLTQGIAAALLALILGWIYLKTDALLLTICMHGTGNMLILLLVQTARGQKLAASPGLWAVALGFFLLAVCYLRRRAAARISA